jgi:hypothetical protein
MENEPSVVPQPGRILHLELVVQIFGDEPESASPDLHFCLREQSYSGSDNDTALARRERRNIGPAAGEVEPDWCGSPENGMHGSRGRTSHCATHHC